MTVVFYEFLLQIVCSRHR